MSKFKFIFSLIIFTMLLGAWMPINVINPNQYLTSSSAPSLENINAWSEYNNNYANGELVTPSIGDQNLNVVADVGNVNADATDFLGYTEAFDLDGTNDCLHGTGTSFDDTGSFSACSWANLDLQNGGVLFSKFNSTASDKSFYVAAQTAGEIDFVVHYDDSDGAVTLDTGTDTGTNLNDQNWHHVCAVYDQTATSLAVYIDGNGIGYTVDSNLSARNNSATADLSFGATDCSGTPANLLNGKMSGFFYQPVALTENQIKEHYCISAGIQCNKDRSGNISILDGRKNNGQYYVYPTADFTVTATAIGTPATGYKIYIPSDGKYKISANLFLRAQDAAAAQVFGILRARIVGGASGDSEIPGAYVTTYFDITSAAGNLTLGNKYDQRLIQTVIYAKKDDIIQVEAWKSSATSTALLEYNSDSDEPYIMWEKLD